MKNALLSILIVLALAASAPALDGYLKQSTAATVRIGPMVDATDFVTAETALTLHAAHIRLSKGGGDFASKNDATDLVHDENGYYICVLDGTDTGTLGMLKLAWTDANAVPIWHDYVVFPANTYDSLVSGSDYLNSETAAMATGVMTAAALDTTFTAEIFDTSLNTYNDKHSAAWWWKQSKTGGPPVDVETGETAQDGGTANTIVLAATSSTRDNAYLNFVVELTAGTGAPASRTIGIYNGTSKTATVTENWPGDSPDSGTTYTLRASTSSALAHEGLAQSGDATHVTLATDAPSVSNIPGWIVLKSGTGAPDTQEVSAYNGTTKVVTVSGWSGASPDNTTYYALIPFGDVVADNPTPTGLTIDEVEYAIDARLDTTDAILGTPYNTDVATDINDVYVLIETLIGDPNNTDVSSDIAALEAMVDEIEADMSTITGSYDVDALYALIWKIWINLP